MKRSKEDSEQTRQNLLKAALYTFREKGYVATRLEDIAHKAAVTRGAIYHHFGSKLEFYETLLAEADSQSQAVMQNAIQEGGTVLDILRRILRGLFEAVEQDPDLRAVLELSLLETRALKEIREKQELRGRALVANIRQAVEIGINSGEIRSELNPQHAAAVILALQDGLIALWLIEPTLFSISADADSLIDILIKGLAK